VAMCLDLGLGVKKKRERTTDIRPIQAAVCCYSKLVIKRTGQKEESKWAGDVYWRKGNKILFGAIEQKGKRKNVVFSVRGG